MTDTSPEPAAPPEANTLAPSTLAPHPGDLGEAPRRASRAMSSPILRTAAALTGVALAWGGVQAARDLWASRHDNTPISSSEHAQSGALRISGHDVTLTFPHGWINVPTTPNELARFLHSSAAEFPHLQAALKNQLENMQNVRDIAMLAYRISPNGTFTGSLNVVVIPASPPPSQLMPHLEGVAAEFGGTHQHDSLTTVGTYAAVLVTWMLPGRAGAPAEYGAQAYVHGPSTTPIITLRTFSAADSITTLRLIADTIKIQLGSPSAHMAKVRVGGIRAFIYRYFQNTYHAVSFTSYEPGNGGSGVKHRLSRTRSSERSSIPWKCRFLPPPAARLTATPPCLHRFR